MKILVADDDAISRLIVQTALQRLGHLCEVVTDGARAWDSFRSERPDVVISDWMMPGLNGLQLSRNIRSDTQGAYTYLILVTSKGGRDHILEGMGAGADDYLIKPLNLDDLQVRLIAAERVTALHRQLADQRAELQGLNFELTSLARRDPLTQLSNRRVLQEDLELLEGRVARYGHRYCMALLDIDHFKLYNDTHGHQAGDQVLRSMSAQLKVQGRSGDAIYRYGGEEFLIIFPEQTLANAILATERVRVSVERLAIPHDANPGGVVTVSAGVAMLDPDHPRSAGDVLKEADDALYQAKHLGRNRVEKIDQAIYLEKTG